MVQNLTELDVAKAVSKTISEELARNSDEFILVHRQCAGLAISFLAKTIDDLSCECGAKSGVPCGSSSKDQGKRKSY